MSTPQCSLGLDADAILSSLDGATPRSLTQINLRVPLRGRSLHEGHDQLDPIKAMEHVATCAACKEVVRLRTLARDVWSNAEDERSAEVTEAAGEETERLRRLWEAPARHAARPPMRVSLRTAFAFAAVPLAAVVVVLVVKSKQAPALEVAKDAPSATSTTFITVPPEVSRREDPRPHPTALSAEVTARSLTVPAGSHVTLGFAIPGGSAELIGPATAETTDTSITLRRGTVTVRELRSVTVNLPTNGAKIDPNGAVCSVDVDERGAARVKVESGHPIVTNRAGAVTQMNPGGSLEIPSTVTTTPTAPTVTVATLPPVPTTTTTEESRPSSPPSVTPSPDAVVRREALAATIAGGGPSSSPPATPEDALATARARLRSGDAIGARADLEKLAASSDAKTARRASFTLAEMDLAQAGGDRAKAHARLKDLVVGPEPALGADAATLLARTMGAPADRAEVWKRYLATNPPVPHADRARLARAEALLDAGQIVDARVLLEDMKKSASLSEPQKKELERLLFKAREMH